MAKILIVEDDMQVATTVRDWLLFEKYLVEHVETGTDALDMLRSYEYDLVILDLALPKMNGIEVCKQYRNRGGRAPILMLTGKDTISEKEVGLDAGGDDYLTKPFHLKELSARIRALLRRPTTTLNQESLQVGNLVMDCVKHTVTRDGELIHLARMEFTFLEFLMRHKDQIFSTEKLLERVWTSDSDKSTEGIRSTVKKLRNKIDTEGKPSLIQNIHGVGYKISEHK